MCGLFGAIGELPEGALDRASRALAHRGPDGEGRFVDGAVALLHRRLAVIDLSAAAAQPMASADGRAQLVFNGEIYNHHALRRELGESQFRSRSDTEAILVGYQRWGEGVVERLDGMFALALWDRERQRLLLARDRAGKKPLFFARRDGVLRFGSSIEALRVTGLSTRVDETMLSMYLANGYVPAPFTLHEGVEQLEPGELAIFERGALTRRRYWSRAALVGHVVAPYAQACSEVRRLVEEAVERRLESDVPLGAFLSGGIDSTIVVGAMARRAGRVRTFSIGFAGDPRYDETRYARIAARAFGTEHTEFVLEPSSFQLLEELVRHHDGPFGDSSAIPTYVVSKLTRQHVTVALTGDGGDEAYCGYHRFLAAEASEWLPAPLRSGLAVLGRRIPKDRSERSLRARALRFVETAAHPLAERCARLVQVFAEPAGLLRPELRSRLRDELDRSLAWHRERFLESSAPTVLGKILDHNFRTYLPYDLLVKADRCSMAASLETRSPFLDTKVVEHAATLPASYLRRGRETKRILKDAFSDVLPAEIRGRGKMGFGVPISTWFRGDLEGYLHDHLGAGARLDAYLDRAAVDRLLAEHRAGRADHGHRLWSLLTLEIWLRTMSGA